MDNLIEKISSPERVSFKLPDVNRDQQIWLGQAIIALIGVNLPSYFTETTNKEDIGLMLIDIAKHFKISIQDLYKYDLIDDKLDPDFDYELETNLTYKIISQKPA